MNKLYNKIYEAVDNGIQKALIIDNGQNTDVSINWYTQQISNDIDLITSYCNIIFNSDNTKEVIDAYDMLLEIAGDRKYKIQNYAELKYLLVKLTTIFGSKPYNLNWLDVSKINDFTGLFSPIYNYDGVCIYSFPRGKRYTKAYKSLEQFNADISGWDVSHVTCMNDAFRQCFKFNQSIEQWDVSNVHYMAGMFINCSDFDKPLNGWGKKVSNVETMSYMFCMCKKFNQPLNDWNVENVKDFSGMFSNCYSFDANVNGWNTLKAKDMSSMFYLCKKFNKPLDQWHVENVSNMQYMFDNCARFNQRLTMWNVTITNFEYCGSMFSNCASMEDKNKPVLPSL